MVANGVEKLCEIQSLTEVRERYELPGPHATVVATIPTPAAVDLDRTAVINASCTQLRHAGADAEIVTRIRDVMERLEPRGGPVLVTGTADDVVFHRLSWEAYQGQVTASVGPLPALLPVVAELSSRGPVVGGLVDRVGADVFLIQDQRLELISKVDGDVEAVTRGGPGASSARRFTNRAEAGVDLHADLVADTVHTAAVTHHAKAVILSGDERAMARVIDHLGERSTGATTPTAKRQAGGRHEPGSPDRLLTAASGVLGEQYAASCRAVLARVARELGPHDRAVNGFDDVRRCVDEGRASLVVFADGEAPFDADLEGLAKDAMGSGAELVVLDPSTPGDGIDKVAALLRY